MAEVVGAVSAGAGLVSAAWKSARGCVEAIEKIKDHSDNIEEIRTESEDLIRVLASLRELAEMRSDLNERLDTPLLRCQQICDKLRYIMNECSKRSEGKDSSSIRDAIRYLFREKGVAELRDRLAKYKLSILVAIETTNLDLRMSEASQASESFPAESIRNFERLISECSSNITRFLEVTDVQLNAIPPGTLDARKKRLELDENRIEAFRCLSFVTEGISSVDELSKRLVGGNTQDNDRFASAISLMAPTRFAVAGFQKSADHLREMKTWLESYGKELDQQMNAPKEEPSVKDPIDDLLMEASCSRKLLPILRQAREVQERATHVFEDILAYPDSKQNIGVTDSSQRIEARRVTARERAEQNLGTLPESCFSRPADIPLRASVVPTFNVTVPRRRRDRVRKA